MPWSLSYRRSAWNEVSDTKAAPVFSEKAVTVM